MKIEVSEFKGPLGELFDQCSGENGPARWEEFKLWLKRATDLLKLVTTVSVGVVEKFRVAEVLGSTGVNRDGVRIAFLGDNFKRIFGPLVEQKIEAAELVVHQLKRYATALDIASAFPAEKRVTTIGQIYRLVRDQEINGKGSLLTNGWANLFLAYGVDGNLWLVYVYRDSGGWDFFALPLDSPSRWAGEHQVFSRK